MIIDKNIFFDSILAPEFILKEFSKTDWVMVIKNFENLLKNNISEEINSEFKNVKISGKVYIGKNSHLGEYSTIEGPVYIGDDVEIGPNVFIRAGSIIGNDCVVGHAAEVKNSLMMDGSKISNHTFLGDSILGVKSRMGGHSETMNRRFDQKEISFLYKDQIIETGLDKLGAIMGSGVRLGGGVLTTPGVMIGKKTFIASGVIVDAFIPENKFVKSNNTYSIKDNNYKGELNQDSGLYNLSN